jgi:hypothetical protein
MKIVNKKFIANRANCFIFILYKNKEAYTSVDNQIVEKLNALKADKTKFFDFVYSHLGGSKYVGRGYNQLTGIDNYRFYGNKIGVDLVSNPDLVSTPNIANKVLIEYMKQGINTLKRVGKFSGKDINDFKDQKSAYNAIYNIDAGAGKDVNITGCDQFKVTTETTNLVPAFQHISAVTTNDNMRLQATGGYSMRIGEGSATNGVVIVGLDSGTSTIDSNASSLTVRSDAVLTLRGDTSVTTTSTTNLNATGSNATNIGNASSTTTQLGTININATGTSTTTIGATGTTTNILGIATFAGTTTFNDPVTFNDNVLIQQQTYPPSNTSALGYSVTTTATEFTFTADTFGTIASFTVPSKGVWICNIIVNYRTTGGAGSFELLRLILSETSTGTTAYRTFEYFDETDASIGGDGKRFVFGINGTLTTTGSTTFYIRGVNFTTGLDTYGTATYSYTRVG